MAAALNSTHQTSVPASSVRRPQDARLQGRIAKKMPYLSLANKNKRHRHWTLEDWKKVLRTDESKVEDFGSNSRTFVRHGTNEQMLEQCLRPSVRHDGGSIGVLWRWEIRRFRQSGRNLGRKPWKESYHKVLQRHAIPVDST